MGLSREKVKALIPVGGAAAVAAAFNAPLAAVLFALEELVGDLHAPVLGSVVLGAATAWMVMRLFLGNDPLFHAPQYQFVHPIEFVVYGVLGLVGGIISLAFVKALLRMRAWFLSLPKWSVWFQPVAGGVLVGILGWFVPQVLGVGYGYVGDALNGKVGLELMALLVLLKLVTVVTSYSSGNAGGIFGPSLFIGAMAGGALGSVAHHLLPNYTATAGAYALVGMGAVFAGIVRAPMTSVIMIFEVTHDYAVIVPLMIANLVSFYISRKFQHEPIYEALALQDGIHLAGAETRAAAARFRVSHAMREPGEILRSQDTIAQALVRVSTSEFHSWPVVDDSGVLGMVSLAFLQRAQSEGAGEKTLDQVIDREPFPHLHDDQSLDLALQRLGQDSLDVIPVVSRANVRELMGIVTLGDVLRKYGVNRSP
jgi:CIC family chloride channel protein